MRWKIPRQAGMTTAFESAKKTRAKPRKLEDPIHILIFNWLDANIEGTIYHVPNGYDGGSEVVMIRGRPVARAAIMWNKLVKLGARSGILDLTIHWAGEDGIGRTAYFEVKSEEGQLGKSQKAFMADLDRCKIPHRLVRSLMDCQKAVRDLGIPLRRFTACVPAR